MAVVLTGCASSGDVGGVWHAQVPRQGLANDLLFGPGDEPLGIELVIGEFGPEVSGLVRYYPSATFEQPRAAEVPDRQCACAFLYQAQVDGGGKVAFMLKGCVPGSATEANLRLRGQFTLQPDDTLLGSFRVDEAKSPLDGRSVELSFERKATAGGIESRHLRCSQPPDVATGNVHSGQ